MWSKSCQFPSEEYSCCRLLGPSPFTRRDKGKGQKQTQVSSSSFPRLGFGAFYHHPWLVGFSRYFVLWLSKLYPQNISPKGRNVLSLDKDSFCCVKPKGLSPWCTDLRVSTKWGLQHDPTPGKPSCFQRDPQIWEAKPERVLPNIFWFTSLTWKVPNMHLQSHW